MAFDDGLAVAAHGNLHFQRNLKLISIALALFDPASLALLDKIGFNAVIQPQRVAGLLVAIIVGTSANQIKAGLGFDGTDPVKIIQTA